MVFFAPVITVGDLSLQVLTRHRKWSKICQQCLIQLHLYGWLSCAYLDFCSIVYSPAGTCCRRFPESEGHILDKCILRVEVQKTDRAVYLSSTAAPKKERGEAPELPRPYTRLHCPNPCLHYLAVLSP
jgi:hypothetical protein